LCTIHKHQEIKQNQNESFKTLFFLVEIDGERRFSLWPPLTPPNGGGFSAMNERYTNVNKIQTLSAILSPSTSVRDGVRLTERLIKLDTLGILLSTKVLSKNKVILKPRKY
jgi:hypothetical protein